MMNPSSHVATTNAFLVFGPAMVMMIAVMAVTRKLPSAQCIHVGPTSFVVVMVDASLRRGNVTTKPTVACYQIVVRCFSYFKLW